VVTWRIPVAALIMAVCLSVIGYAIFPSQPHRDSGLTSYKLPDRQPSNAAWVWPDGVPGWTPGQTIKGFPLTTVQQVELQAAELAAARHGLDASDVHVVDAIRGDRQGVLAILATQTIGETPARTCLAGLLRSDAPVQWVCPSAHVLSHKHVFLAATRLPWPSLHEPVYLTGVARGDVARIVLVGGVSPRQTIYTRAKSWGEFESAQVTSPTARLLVFGGGRLLETVRLDVPVGQQRVLR
jgi:hypothetical protein